MNYKEDKEISDLIKHIKDINKQMQNPNNEIRNVITDIQKSLPKESITFELLSSQGHNTKLISIDNIDINVLYQKLPAYKTMCQDRLIEKCGQKIYEEIIREEKL